MRAPVSFLDLLQEACSLVFRSRQTFLFFSIPFGIFAFGSTQVSKYLTPLLPETTAGLDQVRNLISQEYAMWLTLGGLLLMMSILRSFLRGPFFLTLERLIAARPDSSAPAPPKKRKLFHAGLLSLFFELGFWGACLLLVLIITLPVLAGLRFNPEAVPFLLQLGLLLSLTMVVVFFYLKEFALFYALLAHARTITALELGLKLFKKHFFQSLLFGLFLMALSFLFTFLNLAIIASDFIANGTWHEGVSALGVILVLGLGTVIQEALRLLFFHALAATPKLPAIKAKRLLEEKSPTGAPTI